MTQAESSRAPSANLAPSLEDGSAPLAETIRATTVHVWDLPLVAWTRAQTLDAIDRLIEEGRPSLFVTANLHYAMLTHQRPDLQNLNRRAAFLLADGAPLVWASRWQRTPLPERVTGSDLIYDLAERAALKGHRIYILGGSPGVADRAAENLVARYPGLQIAGTFSPPFRDPSPEEHRALLDRVREARPDILLVAFTMPRGELWIDRNLHDLGVPVCAQVGASVDFVAGRISRAPKWMQKTGLEWFYRMALEPGRLAPRYLQNALFLAKMTMQGLVRRPANGDPRPQ